MSCLRGGHGSIRVTKVSYVSFRYNGRICFAAREFWVGPEAAAQCAAGETPVWRPRFVASGTRTVGGHMAQESIANPDQGRASKVAGEPRLAGTARAGRTNRASGTAREDAMRLLWFRRYPAWQSAVAFLLGLLATAALSIDLSPVSYKAIAKLDPTATGALYICYEVLLSFAGHSDAIVLLALALLLVFPIRYVVFGKGDSFRPSVVIPSAAFALCTVFGMSYDLTDGATLVVGGISQGIKACIMGAGCAVLGHVGFYLFYDCLDWLGTRRPAFSESRFGIAWRAANAVLDRRRLLFPFLLTVLAWSPSYIAAMPGIFMGDTGAQIRQWFNLPNGTSDYLNLINPDVLLNGHHPVAHTALVGGCVQLGLRLFGDENIGLLVYTTLQYLVTAMTVAYLVCSMRRFGCGLAPRAASLAFFLFMPLFSNYAVLITKDVLFADALAVLVVQTAVLLCSFRGVAVRRRDWALLVMSSIGCAFLRNGGLVFPLAACSLAALFCARDAARVSARDGGSASGGVASAGVASSVRCGAAPLDGPVALRRRWIAVLGVAVLVLVLNAAFTRVVMPAFDITPGSRREMLSIPFQQTARFVLKHDGANAGVEGGASDGLVDEEEREVIDRVLGYDTLASRYDPDKSDAVKNGYNEDASASDLAAYFSVWAKMLLRDPESYLSAVANNYYGYFYPSARDVWFYSTVEGAKIMAREENRASFDFHPFDHPLVVACGHMVNLYRVAIQRVPLVSLTMSSASYTWLLIAVGVYLLRSRQWRPLAFMVPLLGVLAVCLVGPCNGSTYMRYLYPAILSLPFALVVALAWPRRLWGFAQGGTFVSERARAK